jgi:hypothetical protein
MAYHRRSLAFLDTMILERDKLVKWRVVREVGNSDS